MSVLCAGFSLQMDLIIQRTNTSGQDDVCPCCAPVSADVFDNSKDKHVRTDDVCPCCVLVFANGFDNPNKAKPTTDTSGQGACMKTCTCKLDARQICM